MGLFDTAAREAFREQGGVSGLNRLGRERSQPQVADQREQATHAQRVRAVGGPANAGPDAILQPLGYILLNPLAGTRENDSLLQCSAGRQELDPNVSLGPCDIALPAAAEAEGRLPAAVRAPVDRRFAAPSSRHLSSLPPGFRQFVDLRRSPLVTPAPRISNP